MACDCNSKGRLQLSMLSRELPVPCLQSPQRLSMGIERFCRWLLGWRPEPWPLRDVTGNTPSLFLVLAGWLAKTVSLARA